MNSLLSYRVKELTEDIKDIINKNKEKTLEEFLVNLSNKEFCLLGKWLCIFEIHNPVVLDKKTIEENYKKSCLELNFDEEIIKGRNEIINSLLKSKIFCKSFTTFALNSQRQFISKELRIKVMERDNSTCQKCGSQENLELSHIIAVCKGGSSTENNLYMLCSKCNDVDTI